MIRHSSVISPLLRLARDCAGQGAISLAFLLPSLLAATGGAIEMGTVMFEQSRMSEATRRAARVAAINDSIADLTDLETTPVDCISTAGTLSCSGGAIQAAGTFAQMVATMRAIMPRIGPDNVQVSYRWTGLGAEESGGIKPSIRVRLVDVQHDFIMLRLVPGMPGTMTLPNFETAQIGKGFVPGP